MFSVLNTVSVVTPWQSLPPKLTLLSHTITGDTIDIMANSSVHIKCTGEKPMMWLFPNNNPVNNLSLNCYKLIYNSIISKALHFL